MSNIKIPTKDAILLTGGTVEMAIVYQLNQALSNEKASSCDDTESVVALLRSQWNRLLIEMKQLENIVVSIYA